MFELLDRAGTARHAVWSADQSRLETPNILFVNSDRFPAPGIAQAFVEVGESETSILLKGGQEPIFRLPRDIGYPLSHLRKSGAFELTSGKNASQVRSPSGLMAEAADKAVGELVSLAGAFELRRDPRELVRALVSLREAMGPSVMIYAPGIMDVENLALLVYLGVDLFDSSLAIYQSARGRALFPEGSLSAEDIDMPSEELLSRNLSAVWNELMRVRWAIEKGNLRELVETRVTSNAWGVAALRLFDLKFYSYQERLFPVTGGPIRCNTAQSLFRPDVRRFRERMMERYRPPGHKRLLLLLPCSARKPYSTSRSHRLFREVLEGIPNAHLVHEVIVTSPLGLVPRELELSYPAAHYDIPVTGHWDCQEIQMIQEMLAHLVSFGYERVLCHLPEEFVSEGLDCVVTCDGSPVSDPSLRRLSEELTEACAPMEPFSRAEARLNDMRSLVRFQFGERGESLLEGTRIVGRFPRLKIMDGGRQLGMLTPERGMVSLTLDGAERLVPSGIGWVRMDDFELKGNLFAVGVLDADPGIRIGDEALVLKGEELMAVGTASMSSREMVEMSRGEAVRIRHSR
jgi:archaeosine synthase alpha-subunit